LKSAYQGRLEIVRLLIENGFDVDTMDNDGETPLFKAIKGRCYGICKFLHENCAKLDITNKYKKTLKDAIQNCDHKLIKSYFANAKQLQKENEFSCSISSSKPSLNSSLCKNYSFINSNSKQEDLKKSEISNKDLLKARQRKPCCI